MSTQPNLSEPQIPDPNGPPVLSYANQKFRWSMLEVSVTTTLFVAVGGVAAFLLLATTTTATSGALRSQHIQWQQRQAEIAQAQAQSDAQQDAAPAEQPHD